MVDAPQTRRVNVDPSVLAVANVYATAFLDAAQVKGVTDAAEELTAFANDAVAANPEFAQLLGGYALTAEQKQALIERVTRSRTSDFLSDFLGVLARHERLDLIGPIAEQAQLQHEQRNNRQRVLARSATELTDEQRAAVADRLRSELGFEPILSTEVDPSLLGGLVIQVGDTVFDGSLRTRLRDLKQRLRQRYLNEIQSGRDRFSHSEGS